MLITYFTGKSTFDNLSYHIRDGTPSEYIVSTEHIGNPVSRMSTYLYIRFIKIPQKPRVPIFRPLSGIETIACQFFFFVCLPRLFIPSSSAVLCFFFISFPAGLYHPYITFKFSSSYHTRIHRGIRCKAWGTFAQTTLTFSINEVEFSIRAAH